MKKYLLAFVFFLMVFLAKAQTYYQCFDSDTHSKLKISVKYVNGTAVSVKYRGQKEAIPLVYVKEMDQNGGAYPVTTSVYNEKYNGKITGKYLITHSGNWDYVEYRSGNGKIFNFTINLDLSVKDDSYRESPCY